MSYNRMTNRQKHSLFPSTILEVPCFQTIALTIAAYQNILTTHISTDPASPRPLKAISNATTSRKTSWNLTPCPN